jgi:hypothetical protein
MCTVSWTKALLLAAAASIVLSAEPASSQYATTTTTKPNVALKTDQFDYEYVPPKNPTHMKIYAMLKDARVLEKFQEFLSPLMLPHRIKLKVEGCDGVANAYFFRGDVKVCYEYFDYIMKYAPKMEREGLSPRDAMIGPVVDVFLHEVGHVVVEELDIPFFGREEDTADYFASYVLLHFSKDDARRLILGASFMGGNEAMEEQKKAPELVFMADTHSLPAQRYFNRWCMAYGADPVLYADAIDLGMLPKNRSGICSYEYKTNEFAFKTLVAPYIDQTLKEKVMAKHWFTFESPVAATRMSKPPPSTPASTEKEVPKALR